MLSIQMYERSVAKGVREVEAVERPACFWILLGSMSQLSTPAERKQDGNHRTIKSL